MKIKNRHKGETILILGCGPSISIVEKEIIRSYTTIGTNWINLVGFEPTYQLSTDSTCLYDADNYFQKTNAHKFWLYPRTFNRCVSQEFRDRIMKINKRHKKQTCFHAYRYYNDGYEVKNWSESVFSNNFDKGLRIGRAVVFAAMNLAYIFGAKEIILLGVDLHKNNHFYPPQTEGQIEDLKMDTFPWKEEILDGFKLIAQFMREKRIRGYNANPYSAVRSFPYKKLERKVA